MWMFRADPPPNPLADVDQQLSDAVAQLRRARAKGRDENMLRRHIDDLLERRLETSDAAVIHDCERQLTRLGSE